MKKNTFVFLIIFLNFALQCKIHNSNIEGIAHLNLQVNECRGTKFKLAFDFLIYIFLLF